MQLRSIVIFLIFALLPQTGMGQAWTQKAGSVYAKVFYGQSAATEQFTFDGTLRAYADNVDYRPYVEQAAYLYTDIGLTNTVTFFGTIPYKRIRVRDTSFEYQTRAIGSAEVGLSVSLARIAGATGGRNAASISIVSSIPLGYTRNYAPSAGSGQVNVGALLSYGRSFYPAPFYAQFSVGFEHPTSFYDLSVARDCQVGQDLDCVFDSRPEFDDLFLYSAELGLNLGRRILVQGVVGGVWSIEAPDIAFSVYNPFPTRQRYVKAGGGVRIQLPGSVGLSGQIRFTPVGANTIKSTDYFVGLDISFSTRKCCKEKNAEQMKQKEKPESADVPFSKPHQRRY
ncbi:MAG: hypothetical protein HKN43_07555 [Rhodothermales bacterium]|nr:hypothetical protein [Rhodothermales bacterium]